MAPPRRRVKIPLHLGRYREILGVLVKHGFSGVLYTLPLGGILSITRRILSFRRPVDPDPGTWPARMRQALEELGPTFIKLGQFLSHRPDLLPPETIRELEKLQDAVKPIPSAEARALLELELGAPIEETLARFDAEPLAAASMAQVHRGRLRSGEEVALKIQRPNLGPRVHQDILILHNLAALLEQAFEWARLLRLSQLAEEFDHMLMQELDFRQEAQHIETFRVHFARDSEVHIPRVHEHLTTERLLVTEYIDGFKIHDPHGLSAAGISAQKLAKRGAKFLLTQIFEHGYFHADPHAGNIRVMRDGTLCFLDYGAVGQLAPSLRTALATLLYSVVTRDPARVVKTLSELSGRPGGSLESLELDLAEFMEHFGATRLKQMNLGKLLTQFGEIVVRHELRIVPGFYILLKSLMAIEGVGRRLDPDFDLIGSLKPFVRRQVLRPHDLKSWHMDAWFTLGDSFRLLRDLPGEIRQLLRSLRSGEMTIRFEHRGLDPLMQKADLLVSRLSFALVLSALIIGSSVVIHSGIPPVIFGLPLIGLAGFAVAAIIGFALLFTMIRGRRW